MRPLLEYDKEFRLAEGQVATDGVAYSAVATVGTTAVTIFSKFFDPSKTVKLDRLEVGLTKRFTGLNGSFVGSMIYYWTIQSKYKFPSGGALVEITGDEINISGTYQVAVGTLTTHDDTMSHNQVASIPFAPFTVNLKAIGIRAGIVTGQVKNSSYVRLVGVSLPGTD